MYPESGPSWPRRGSRGIMRGMTTLLRGARVALRPLEKTDLPAFTAWFSRYELHRMLTPGAIRLVNTDTEETWYRSMLEQKDAWLYAIEALDDPHQPDGRLIGSTSLFRVDGKNRSADFGIAIADPAMRGKGYGGEIIDLMLEWAFLELNLHRVQLTVVAFNTNAIKLYERKGFKHDGSLRDAIWREGRYWDNLVMSVLRPEWTPPRTFGAANEVMV